MVNVKKVRISKLQLEVPFTQVLGLHILRLIKKGYDMFRIIDHGEEIEIRAWRSRVKKEGEKQ